MHFAVFLLLLSVIIEGSARKYRRKNEVGIVNMCDANLRIRCQSVITDHKDTYLGPQQQFRFRFIDIDRGNMHFWCDAYGLFGFSKNFDVFGREAPSRTNLTWFITPDGLYLDNLKNRMVEWHWTYPPFLSYAE